MAFETVGTFKLADTITALTVPGFTIPVRAVFEPDANTQALAGLLKS